ncbi:carboxypeptidase-like regulatory domain-containing protein [Nocardioides sp.]|uniref:carboxypeptidase-like regulatory domain-containing protein n=1 Tax=Nocardioides sp. TaxID=35761 RepID=UPI002721C3CF|nr:carboxypeptidase-like regulatory domain-containing protein [Nocardioides sp.]MDO9456988.1 carboxypeptidase-like regulatory domain-containing protein [Nocardioides sp.]
MTTSRCSRSVLGVVVAALLLVGPLVAPTPSEAVTNRWASWTPVTGSSNDYALRMLQRAPGFPAAVVATDSRSNVQLPSGATSFLGPGTPPGAAYGTSQGSPYLSLRPKADNATSPSTTTYTFDHPTPDTGWAFVLGDVDADQVEVRALDASGATVSAAEIGTWFRGTFNYAGGADLPTWDAAGSTLVGNPTAADTDGASGWFEPDVRLRSLTFVFTRRAGFPVYQTWFVSRARPIGGTVDDVSVSGACAVQDTVVTLVSPWGEALTAVSPDATGAYDLGELATQAGWTVRLTAPPGCAIVGPAALPVDNRGEDGAPASRADFEVRQVVPQPISGTVADAAGRPVAGVTITLVRPDATTTERTTGSDGGYLFDDNPVADGYSLTMTVPDGYAPGPGGTVITGIDVDTTAVVDQDFVLRTLPAVTGRVTGGGSGLGGVRVTLTPVGGGPSRIAVTLGDGSYAFAGVAAGDVTITVDPPAGYGGDTTREATVGAADVGDQDFALTRAGAVSGAVTDENGGVEGIPVVIDGPGPPATTVTDAAGGYYTGDLVAGAYTASVTPPDGFDVDGSASLPFAITAAGEIRGGRDFQLVQEVTPSPTPTPTSTPSPTTEPSDGTTTSPPSSDGSGSGVGPDGLPDTGGPPGFLLGVGVLLVASGVALLSAGRSRRRRAGRRTTAPGGTG